MALILGERIAGEARPHQMRVWIDRYRNDIAGRRVPRVCTAERAHSKRSKPARMHGNWAPIDADDEGVVAKRHSDETAGTVAPTNKR
jgi:hypothetical protein